MCPIFTSTCCLRKLSASFLLASLVALGATSVQAQKRDPDLGSPTAKNQKATSTSEVIDALGLEESDVASLEFGSSDPTGHTTFSDPAAEFPQKGDNYLTLSTGCAGAALDPDDSGSFSCDLGGLTGPGGATDMVQMELELNVPEGATSVLFDFKYLSEEFPEFVGSAFNDGFVVEVEESTFTVDGNELEAPDNVAFDSEGNPITVNTVFGVSEDEASGTTYDGGTDKLTTSVPVPSGESRITLIFSIFDVSDEVYDSTIFLDNVRFQKQDLELTGFEVNQSIQDWQNSVPLIENKTTVVRAHLQSTGDSTISPPLNASLKAYRNGNELENSPQGANNIGDFEAPEHLQVNSANEDEIEERRSDLSESLNFTLPSNWLSGTVTLELAGEGIDCSEAAEINNSCELQVDFKESEVPEITFFEVHWTDKQGKVHKPDVAMDSVVQRLTAMYPTDKIAPASGGVIKISYEDKPIGVSGPPEARGGIVEGLFVPGILDKLETKWEKDVSKGSIEEDKIYYGLVSNVEDEIGGQASDIPGNVALTATDGTNNVPNTTAHEVGHLLGLSHAVNAEENGTKGLPEPIGTTAKGYCGSEAIKSNAIKFPYSSSEAFAPPPISALGPSGSQDQRMYGVSTDVMEVATTTDLEDQGEELRSPNPEIMGYCPNTRWVSDTTYVRLRKSINARFGPGQKSMPASAAVSGSATGTRGASPVTLQEMEYLTVKGQIDLSENTAVFRPFTSTTAPPSRIESLLPEPGNYTLQMLDESGNVVEEVSFKPDVGVSKQIPTTASFTIPVEADPNIVKARVLQAGGKNGEVKENENDLIGSRTASENPPSVTVESPNGGETLSGNEVAIEWSGSDPDGDDPTYTVQYSRDGGSTWQTLNTGWSQKSLTVNSNGLGKTTEGLIRVQASDGFNTAEDISDGTFTVPNTAPDAFIQTPSGGAEIDTSASVLLNGGATDLEDDQLSGSNLQWSSNIDGSLGTGETVNVPSSGLSVGTHDITLTATDSDGATDEAMVTIEVTEPSAETVDQSPKLNDAIPDQGLPLSDSLKYGVGSVFEDPIGDGLTYSALSSDPGVVMPSTEEDTLLIEPVDEGTADVIVTAENPEGVARDTFEVEVTDFPPSAVTNFQIESVEDTPGEEEVVLSWQPPKVGDLKGHHVYRSVSPVTDTSGAVRLNDSLTTDTSYADSTVSSRKTYYYRVTAVDTSGNVSKLSSEVRAFLYPDQVSANVSRSFGDASGPSDYRLVGLPGQANQPLAEAIEGEAGTDWQVYWDNDGEFVKFDGSDTFTFRKGRGFWLTSRDEWTVQTNFETVSLKSDTAAVIDLHDGWNIISNPTGKAIPFNAIQVAHPDTLQVFWPFGGAFNAPADTIQSARSGVAYYFNNTTGLDSLTLPYPDAPVTKNIAAADKSHENQPSPLILSARPKGARKQIASAVRFGFDPGATRGLDPQDLIAPPGRFEQLSLRIKSSTASKRDRDPTLMGEWRPPISATNKQDSGHTFRLRLASRTETPVSIEVESFGDMQKRKVVLLYPQTGKTYDLRSNEQVTIDPEKKEAALKLAVGTNAYVESQKEKVVPNEVTVVSYPNPVQEQATIEYTLPEAKKVRLAVYDVLGRRVAVLEDDRMEAGRHRVRLEAARLSSGIYFGRLEAGEQTRTRKITVVR